MQTTVESTPQRGGKSGVDRQAFQRFKSELRGRVLLPEDADYEPARRIWNGMIDKKPALIVRCAGTTDVQACVRFARAQGLPLAIRGGGHNIAGSSLCDGGLVIDFPLMRSVQIDHEAKRARVEPGATLADFDCEAQAFGLATPLGINSTTGVAGLTLGGGFGWLSRKYGMTVDSLLSVQLVTADGHCLQVREHENADLFWALRGGGGNFGVVTRFEFRLHPVGPDVYCGLIAYPFEQAKQVLGAYDKLVDQAPDELSVWVVMRDAPPLPFLPTEVHGRPVVILAAMYVGNPREGERLLEPYRRLGDAHGEHLGVQPYRAFQQAFDPLLGPGARNYWKSHNLGSLSQPAVETCLKYLSALPSPQCEVFFGLLGGQASRVPASATAYPSRDAKYAMNVHTRWDKPEQDRACIDWARSLFDAMKPHALGSVYVNFLTDDERDRVPAAYGDNYERLARIKQQFDPDNLFRTNQNIKPAS